VLDPGRRRTKTGYLWAIARDDRPWGGTDPPAVVYLYAPGRGAEHTIRPLAGFRGILQVDGGACPRAGLRPDPWAAYQALTDPGRAGGPVTLAYCWSHVRRRFYEIAQGGNAPIAEAALQRINVLYHVEAIIRGQAPEQRQAVRQEQSKPVIDDLRTWLDAQLAKIPRRARIAEAIRYALKLWSGLRLFLDDGRIEIDTNVVERSIRPIALNRKNALFAGSDQGATHWGVIASLIETCKLNAVDPQVYLADVLSRLVNRHPASQIDQLMPWAYANPVA
jgi:transposase